MNMQMSKSDETKGSLTYHVHEGSLFIIFDSYRVVGCGSVMMLADGVYIGSLCNEDATQFLEMVEQ